MYFTLLMKAELFRFSVIQTTACSIHWEYLLLAQDRTRTNFQWLEWERTSIFTTSEATKSTTHSAEILTNGLGTSPSPYQKLMPFMVYLQSEPNMKPSMFIIWPQIAFWETYTLEKEPILIGADMSTEVQNSLMPQPMETTLHTGESLTGINSVPNTTASSLPKDGMEKHTLRPSMELNTSLKNTSGHLLEEFNMKWMSSTN